MLDFYFEIAYIFYIEANPFFFFFVWASSSLGSPCVWHCGLTMATHFSVQGGSFLCSHLSARRRGEIEGGSWKWPCHMGNNSTLRSERTHKRPHYLQQHRWPACEETESHRASASLAHLLKYCLCAVSCFCLEVFHICVQ